jgi:hypothetical protein
MLFFLPSCHFPPPQSPVAGNLPKMGTSGQTNTVFPAVLVVLFVELLTLVGFEPVTGWKLVG